MNSAYKDNATMESRGAPTAIADDEKKEKIYCANCIHCKVVRTPSEDSDQYFLRVRCVAGKWRKKLGGEKVYKYFTVARRSIDECDSYEPMGDPTEFIRDLKKTLPIRDEAYTAEQ
jgi:hypothetical protein